MLVDYRGDPLPTNSRNDPGRTTHHHPGHRPPGGNGNRERSATGNPTTGCIRIRRPVAGRAGSDQHERLDDILGAIVRITPILVGVERCILFCRDTARHGYRATHAYGLSSKAETGIIAQQFAPGDFGLLDAITRENQLVICDRGDPDGTMIPLQFADYMDYLSETGHTLLGFPLSVKGDVLGALVLEEPAAPRSVQERRIEIITGIAQQAALALQNDQLQQSRLGQERLERELQLAREIQQTFIPDRRPQMEGWHISAVWRAARQVAGDFYDLLELPEGKLGLLIADVADKGMPAALFMMLTRTLVRAAVRNSLSPAQVLTSVNDLLVPDAKKGMFVTAFYAVLSPDSGQLVMPTQVTIPPCSAEQRRGQPNCWRRVALH